MEVAIKKTHHEFIDLAKLAGRVRIVTTSVQLIFTTVAIVRIAEFIRFDAILVRFCRVVRSKSNISSPWNYALIDGLFPYVDNTHHEIWYIELGTVCQV